MRPRIQSYLCIKPVLLCNLSDYNQAFRSNLTSCNARDNRESAIALDVSQESIIGILILVVNGCHNVLVITVHNETGIDIKIYDSNSQTRQDATDGRLADFTPNGIFVDTRILHNLHEGSQVLDADDIEYVSARHSEVRT